MSDAWVAVIGIAILAAFALGVTVYCFHRLRDVNGPVPPCPDDAGIVKRIYWWVLGP